MSVTEYDRNQLFTWFEEHMGKERAATMMSLLPPAGWADVATKRDLDVIADRIDARFERVDARFDALEARLATKAELQELRADLQRTFVMWMFAAQGAVVAAIGLLLAVIR